MIAVPSNVGPRTMPEYDNLFDQGIHDLGDGVKVFAGTTDDPFWIDLGAAFDSFNFRAPAPVLDATEDGGTGNVADARDDVSGFNVNTIAIEVPISMVSPGDPVTIGTWATTSRPRVRVLKPPNASSFPLFTRPNINNPFVQIQRMGNPLINELIIGTGSKDLFSMSDPVDDAQFADFVLDPLLPRVINAVYGLTVPDAPRLDLLPLASYSPPIAGPGIPPGPVADMLEAQPGRPPHCYCRYQPFGTVGG